MVIYGTLLLISATVIGCTAASISSECERHNRKTATYYIPYSSFDPHTDCGRCLNGYTEVDGSCIFPGCPSAVYCKNLRRQKCTSQTNGECGKCSDEFLEVEGICVTEKEVKRVIADVEAILNENKWDESSHNVEEPVIPKAETIGKDEGAEQIQANDSNSDFIDKKSDSEIEVNNQQIIVDKVKNEESPKTDAPSNTTFKPSDDKRVGEQVGSADVRIDKANEDERHEKKIAGIAQIKFFAVVMSLSLICLVTIVVVSVCAHRLYRKKKLTETSDYQGYGGGDSKSSVSRSESGDRKLAHSAQMYHYQHHKQQMMALEKSQSDSVPEGTDNEEEISDSEDGKYRVYECPGLAPTGEMEVQNPLFLQNSSNPPSGKPSPVSTSSPPVSPRSDHQSTTSSD